MHHCLTMSSLSYPSTIKSVIRSTYTAINTNMLCILIPSDELITYGFINELLSVLNLEFSSNLLSASLKHIVMFQLIYCFDI